MKKTIHILGVKIKKDILFFSIAITLILLAVFLVFNNISFLKIVLNWVNFQKNNYSINGIILFYGQDCDHCVTVDNFIAKNNIEDKLVFTKLEVFNDRTNANMLISKAKICGLEDSQIGVPFLWDGKNCVIGDVDVIKFFQEKISKKQ